jgi:ABC-2 type transport system ATP-binding protein
MGIAEIRELIKRIADDGRTIILASHLLDEVQKVCTHFAILKRGSLIHTGPVDDVGKGAEIVEVNAKVEGFSELIQQYQGASAIVKENGIFQLTLQDGFHSRDVNKYLFENGVVADHLVTKKRSLEKMFIEILADTKQ